jgi:hypothetical protein
MKKKHIFIGALYLLVSSALISCKDEVKNVLIPYPNDINFEDQNLDRLSYRIPDAPFKAGDSKSGVITVNVKKNNDGTYSGFALSNKSWRSYPWSLSSHGPGAPNLTQAQLKSAIDSTVFSVYTTPAPSQTKNYLVGHAVGEDAAITLDNPAVVEHVLVANNTYNFLLANYGSKYSGTLDANTQEYDIVSGTAVRNPNNPNTAANMYGRFHLPGPGGVDVVRLAGSEILAKRAAGHAAAEAVRANPGGLDPAEVETKAKADSTTAASQTFKGHIKLIAKGYNGTAATGTVEFWLAVRPNVDGENPTWDIIVNNWYKMDLTGLGTVTKIVFNMESSDPNIPPYFCLDGMRIKQ